MGKRFTPHFYIVVGGLIIVICIALASSGCAVATSRGTHFFWQRGVVLSLIHTCTTTAKVYQAGRGLVADVTGAEPFDIALEPPVPGMREVQATVQSLDSVGRIVGSYTERFYIDEYSTTTQTWVISNNWSGGGSRQSRCQ